MPITKIRREIRATKKPAFTARAVNVRRGATVLAPLFILLSGCNGGSSAPTSPQFVPCPAIEGLGQLVYPVGGTTPVNDPQNLIVVAGGIGTASLILKPVHGTPIVSSTQLPVPNPLPAPNSPSQLTPVTAFRIPALSTGTTYTVTTSTGLPCRTMSLFGSFTTR